MALTIRGSRGRRRAAQSVTKTPATQMTPQAATTTAVVISPFPYAQLYAGRHLLYMGCVGSHSLLPEQRGVRYTPRPQVAGTRSLPLVCHDYSTGVLGAACPPS